MTGIPLLVIPRMDADALVEFRLAFRIVLGRLCVPMVLAPVCVFRIPLNNAFPEVEPNVVPVFERFAPVVRFPILRFGLVAFPMVFPETLYVVEVPDMDIPVMAPQILAVVPIASMF